MNVYFDIKHLYYLPQYIPVIDALRGQNIDCFCLIHQQAIPLSVTEQYLTDNELKYSFVENDDAARKYYLSKKPDWIFFGNAFYDLEAINKQTNTVLMQHGIGPKSCYYDVSNSDITHRFVEGKHRQERLQKMFPSKSFINTGYAKLDPIVNNSVDEIILNELGLNDDKPTILYAPTFYPSSIECLSPNFPESLSNYNLIIKPHFFSFIKKKYSKQRKVIEHWQTFDNVHLVDISKISILPYMNIADILISDASSTLFEFTALNKPAIWCDFYHVRWSYKGIFKWRLNKRLDNDLQYFGQVAQRVVNEQELINQIENHYHSPGLKELERQKMTEFLTGKMDGHCSQRIVNFITTGTI
jgi:CDP-glycerol glycerophosphotransferase (TagB/SpsB family)